MTIDKTCSYHVLTLPTINKLELILVYKSEFEIIYLFNKREARQTTTKLSCHRLYNIWTTKNLELMKFANVQRNFFFSQSITNWNNWNIKPFLFITLVNHHFQKRNTMYNTLCAVSKYNILCSTIFIIKISLIYLITFFFIDVNLVLCKKCFV